MCSFNGNMSVLLLRLSPTKRSSTRKETCVPLRLWRGKKKGASDIKRWLRNTLTIETREKYGANVVRREKNKNVQRPAAATFQRSADRTRDEEEGTFRDRLSHRDEVVFPAAQFWSGG